MKEETRYANIYGFSRFLCPTAHNEMRAPNTGKLSNGLNGTLSNVSFLDAGPSLFILPTYVPNGGNSLVDGSFSGLPTIIMLNKQKSVDLTQIAHAAAR
jgi:hypothetical protein